ncbi:glycine-rich cell wall structural protein-like [Eucalyptus grandis]|uniref:glycine-rich cell wall structural protein-like n=1 Tax=Eucalyptus grandis TaxID=71139 RepID=UPI00192E8908|nr:glycine-rich cell wall structural protein-like [Eucalyptus grandis]
MGPGGPGGPGGGGFGGPGGGPGFGGPGGPGFGGPGFGGPGFGGPGWGPGPGDRGVRGWDSEVHGDLAVASSDLEASSVGSLMAYAAWYLLACTACAVAGCCKIASAGRAGMALPVLEVLQATDPEMF